VFWAGGFLDYWCFRALRSRLEPMKKVARMLRAHEPLLLNWFRAKGEKNSRATLVSPISVPLYTVISVYTEITVKYGKDGKGKVAPSAATNPVGVAARGKGDDRPSDLELHPVRAAGRDDFTRGAEHAGV
jgi:hypothetical protein